MILDFGVSAWHLAAALAVNFAVEAAKKRMRSWGRETRRAAYRALAFYVSAAGAAGYGLITGEPWSAVLRDGLIVTVLAIGVYDVGGLGLFRKWLRKKLEGGVDSDHGDF